MAVSEFGLTAMEDKDDKCPCCEMSCKTRIIGGIICSGIGTVFAIIGWITLIVNAGDLTPFGVLYTISIIAAVAASFFFAGPKKHLERCKVLCHIVASAALLGCIVLVFVFAFAIKDKSGRVAMVIIAFIGEVVSLIFFYITLNRIMWAAAKAFLGRCFPCCG
jgi:hypothetical protein